MINKITLNGFGRMGRPIQKLLDPTDNPQTYTIYRMPESVVGPVYSSPLKMRNRYEGRQFQKDYAKRKKAKHRQQKQSRRCRK